MTTSKQLRVNEQITAPTVLLIDETGKSVGEISKGDALRIAEERGFDLIEVSPQAVPPVCKLLDYGKMKYEETRAERRAKAHQKTIEVKEIRLGVKISPHDSLLKVQQAQKFLSHGNKVHLVLRMRGREQAFPDRAYQLLENIMNQIGGKIEQAPTKLGNQISATIAHE